jgi:hypothetical protein
MMIKRTNLTRPTSQTYRQPPGYITVIRSETSFSPRDQCQALEKSFQEGWIAGRPAIFANVVLEFGLQNGDGAFFILKKNIYTAFV